MAKANIFLLFCLGNQEETFAVHHHGGVLDDGGEEEEDTLHQHDCFMEGGGPGSFSSVNTELTQNEQVIPTLS